MDPSPFAFSFPSFFSSFLHHLSSFPAGWLLLFSLLHAVPHIFVQSLRAETVWLRFNLATFIISCYVALYCELPPLRVSLFQLYVLNSYLMGDKSRQTTVCGASQSGDISNAGRSCRMVFTVPLSRCLFKYDLCRGYRSLSQSRRRRYKKGKDVLRERRKSDGNEQQGGGH